MDLRNNIICDKSTFEIAASLKENRLDSTDRIGEIKNHVFRYLSTFLFQYIESFKFYYQKLDEDCEMILHYLSSDHTFYGEKRSMTEAIFRFISLHAKIDMPPHFLILKVDDKDDPNPKLKEDLIFLWSSLKMIFKQSDPLESKHTTLTIMPRVISRRKKGKMPIEKRAISLHKKFEVLSSAYLNISNLFDNTNSQLNSDLSNNINKINQNKKSIQNKIIQIKNNKDIIIQKGISEYFSNFNLLSMKRVVYHTIHQMVRQYTLKVAYDTLLLKHAIRGKKRFLKRNQLLNNDRTFSIELKNAERVGFENHYLSNRIFTTYDLFYRSKNINDHFIRKFDAVFKTLKSLIQTKTRMRNKRFEGIKWLNHTLSGEENKRAKTTNTKGDMIIFFVHTIEIIEKMLLKLKSIKRKKDLIRNLFDTKTKFEKYMLKHLNVGKKEVEKKFKSVFPESTQIPEHLNEYLDNKYKLLEYKKTSFLEENTSKLRKKEFFLNSNLVLFNTDDKSQEIFFVYLLDITKQISSKSWHILSFWNNLKDELLSGDYAYEKSKSFSNIISNILSIYSSRETLFQSERIFNSILALDLYTKERVIKDLRKKIKKHYKNHITPELRKKLTAAFHELSILQNVAKEKNLRETERKQRAVDYYRNNPSKFDVLELKDVKKITFQKDGNFSRNLQRNVARKILEDANKDTAASTALNEIKEKYKEQTSALDLWEALFFYTVI